MPRQAHSPSSSWSFVRATFTTVEQLSCRIHLDVGGFHRCVNLVAEAQLECIEGSSCDLGSQRKLALDADSHSIAKSVDPASPYQSGDVVTITLKYSNNTRQEITDLVLSDVLSPRLEYVPGTAAAANHISTVTTSESDAGSTTIRFDIPGPIRPGDSGYVVFKVKIR